MTKQTFLEQLNRRLSVLNDQERRDIIDEYTAHINMKVSEGMTEEDAVKDFGDFDLLVEDLLSAYHVNPSYHETKKEEKYTYIENVFRFIGNTCELLLNMKFHEIVRLICRLLILLMITGVILCSINIGVKIFQRMFIYNIPVIGSFLSLVVGAIWAVLSVVLVCCMIYSFIKRYPLNFRSETLVTQQSNFSDREKATMQDNVETNSMKKRKEKLLDDEIIRSVFIWIIRIFIIMVVFIPGIFAFLTLLLGTAVITMLSVVGYPLIGISLMLIGATIIAYLILAMIYQVVFRSF